MKGFIEELEARHEDDLSRLMWAGLEVARLEVEVDRLAKLVDELGGTI